MEALSHLCPYCERCFDTNESFCDHKMVCKYFHQNRYANNLLHVNNQVNEGVGVGGGGCIRDILVYLLDTCRDLRNEVQNLKLYENRERRGNIQEYLNRFVGTPGKLFIPWAATISVPPEHVVKVFESHNRLVDGMKSCLLDYVSKWKSTRQVGIPLPICVFKDKTALYIYHEMNSDVPKWQICHLDQWNRFVNILHHEFRRTFLVWEDSNESRIRQSNYEKDLHFQNMTKIMGEHAIREKEKHELKIWLYTQLVSQLDSTL